jgi:monovalent cation/hydrogen antiporter
MQSSGAFWGLSPRSFLASPPCDFNPDVALFLFLAPLAYSSAVELPWPEFRDHLRSIAILAIVLVVVTTAVAAVVAHSFMGISWPVATVLGAVVSPTDTVAASAIASRMGMPRQLTAILEGEGLANDAVALTVLRIAVVASDEKRNRAVPRHPYT